MVKDSVFCRRSFNTDDAHLPVILIYPNSESTELFDRSPKSYKRFYEFVIEIISTHDTDDLLCDELDDLVFEVENAIESDPVLRGWKPYSKDGHCLEETLATSLQFDHEGNGSSPIGSARLVFNSVYIHDPSFNLALKDLNNLEIGWEIGDHGDNKAIDQLDL